MKTKNIACFTFLLFFLYFFLIYDANFHGADEPVYFAYTASIVEDGDLNVINQNCSQSGQFIVSRTYNSPDFHNYGGVILWAPFYTYAKFIYFIAGKLDLTGLTIHGFEKFSKCAMSFSTMFFGFIAILLTYMFCKIFFSNKTAFWSTLMIFLGTPFFYYMLFNPGNANIVACLFSILSIWFCSYAVNMRKLHWVFYGLFFSICVTVKTELWFQIFFIVPLFITLVMMKKIALRNGIYFLSGFIPLLLLRAVNAHIKYGALHMEEVIYLASIFRHQLTYCANGLFNSYRGILYTSPIFYFCLLGFIFILVNVAKSIRKTKPIENISKGISKEKKMQDIFFLILTTYSIVKLILIGRMYNPAGDTLTMRVLLTEFPCFVILYGRAIQSQRRYLVYPLIALSVFFVFWNLLIISEYMAGLDWLYITGLPIITERIKAVKYALDSLFYVNDLELKLKGCLFLLLAGLGITFYILRKSFIKPIRPSFWYNKDSNSYMGAKLLSLVAICLSAGYFIITSLNMWNNRINVERLRRDGFFENAKIIEVSPGKMTEFEEEQPLWTVFEMKRYYTLTGNLKMANYVKKFKEKLFGEKECCVANHFFQPVRAYYSLVNFYNTRGRYKKAIDCYQEIIRSDPDDIDAYIGLGDVYIITGDYLGAISAFEKAIQINPDSFNACIRLARTYRRTSNFKKTYEYFQRYLQLNPHSLEAYGSLGTVYSNQGEYDRAIECFSQAVKISPGRADFYCGLGDVYNKVGQYEKAKNYFEKAVERNPRSADNYVSLGAVYLKQGEYDRAIECFSQAVKINPGRADFYCDLGDVYNKVGQYEKAKNCFEKAIEKNPRSANSYSSLGAIYSNQGEYHKAIECFSQAVEINPGRTDFYYQIGHAYNETGNYLKAIECFGQVVKLNPKQSDIYYHLGAVYVKAGDTKNALKQLIKLRELKRDNLANELEQYLKE